MTHDFTEEDARQVLQVKLGHQDFTVVDFKLDDAANLRFHSDNNFLVVNAAVKGQEERHIFFFKTVDLNGEVYRRYLGPNRIFEKEHVILTELIPELQKTACRKITAECYLSKELKFIVLEDLTPSGFKPCHSVLDVEHAKLALRALANFHAASIAHEEKLGVKLGDKYQHTLYESLPSTRSDTALGHSLKQQLLAFGCKYLTRIDSDKRNRVFNQLQETANELRNPSNKFRNVITHGDTWGNNILYKYEDSKPIDVILVDFQTVRHAPPAQDLAMFFYVASPNSKFIQDNMIHLREFYYESLSCYLSDLGLDITRILSKEDFIASCEEYIPFGIWLRAGYTMITRLPLKLLTKASQDPIIFCDLMVGGSTDLIFEAYENHPEFTKAMDEAIDCVFDYYKE